MADGFTVAVHQRDGIVVLAARGDLRGDAGALRELAGVALVALDDQPAVIAICDLYVHRADGLAALRWLLRQRPPSAPTVVIARSAQRRRLHGVFGTGVAWYPAELTTPWIGVAASLSHRRRHLTGDQRSDPGEELISSLLWAAAREREALPER
jgi:CheY-like chemotaxis protein